MRPKLLTVANHDTMLNLGCDCRMRFLNTPKARVVKNCSGPKKKLQLRLGLLGVFIGCLEDLVIFG